MALDLVAITHAAMQTATRAGGTAPAIITRPVGPPHPLTGAAASGTPVSQAVDVSQVDARKKAKGGGGERVGRAAGPGNASWTAARVVLFVAAAACTFTPKRGDRVTWAGQTLTITETEDYAPTGAVIGYFLALGDA